MEAYVAPIVAFIAFYISKNLLINDLSSNKAKSLLIEGAIIIDVRSEEEYMASNIKEAVNVPLNDIDRKIGETVPDRDRTILLYCRTGSRSFIGKRILKRMRYSNVYNLGSIGRARRMVRHEKNNGNL